MTAGRRVVRLEDREQLDGRSAPFGVRNALVTYPSLADRAKNRVSDSDRVKIFVVAEHGDRDIL